jgi:hypothetical protein
MRFSNAEIKADLLDRYDEIDGASDTDHALTETADGYVPVYSSEIVKDWAEMPSEFDDSWLDYGQDPASGIVRLMSVDLFVYYDYQTRTIWAEILEEKAGL